MSSSENDTLGGGHHGVDAGPPLPDLRAGHIRLDTIAPALGVPSQYAQPDYLEYDAGGRGVVVTMFANTGMSYLLGILGGGAYGLSRGIALTPSSKFKVKLNSILNHCGRYGSKAGNTLGVMSCIYSLYEGLGDQLDLDRYSPIDASIAPVFGATMTGLTYYSASGIRVAGLAGTLGLGMVGVTYVGYAMIGKPYGSYGYLFF